MLHTLIAEDELTSRKVLNALLAPLGTCDLATNGKEALEAFDREGEVGAAFRAGNGVYLVEDQRLDAAERFAGGAIEQIVAAV